MKGIIEMEIRNNTPAYGQSFGMALRKPKAEQVEEFTEYVIGKRLPVQVRKGLNGYLQKHAKDEHFDIEYVTGKGFQVLPTSEKAQEMFPEGALYMVGDKNLPLNSVGRFFKAYCGEEYAEKYNKASRFGKVLLSTKKFFAGFRAYGKAIMDSKEVMPATLRAASQDAKAYEKAVKTQIAHEASEAAKKEKNIEMVKNVFEPKKK